MATITNNSTFVCVFDSMSDAQAAIRDLVSSGITRDHISLVANDKEGAYQGDAGTVPSTGDTTKTTDGTSVGENVAGGALFGGLGGLLLGLGALAIPGVGPVIAAGPLAAAIGGALTGAAGGGIIGGLKDAGVPDDDASFYAEHLRRGGVVVSVDADPAHQDTIEDILDRHNAIEVGSRVSEYKQGGWAGFDANAAPYTGAVSNAPVRTQAAAGTVVQGQQAIPVVEEELVVGKREVRGGGIRVYNRITERPVEEQVQLRQETAHVERRPVNRPATEADFSTKDNVIEVTETNEEAVVGKTARVVEEVVVGKDVSQRTETVRDTVRRTDIEVEQLGTTDYDTDYRSHFTSSYGSTKGASYETYAPAYQYGNKMASDPSYSGMSYEQAEDKMRTDYLRNNPNSTWDNVKGAVRYGWEKVSGKR